MLRLLIPLLVVGCQAVNPGTVGSRFAGRWISTEVVYLELDAQQEGTRVSGSGSGLHPPDASAPPVPFVIAGSSEYPTVDLSITANRSRVLHFIGTFQDADTIVGQLRDPALSDQSIKLVRVHDDRH